MVRNTPLTESQEAELRQDLQAMTGIELLGSGRRNSRSGNTHGYDPARPYSFALARRRRDIEVEKIPGVTSVSAEEEPFTIPTHS